MLDLYWHLKNGLFTVPLYCRTFKNSVYIFKWLMSGGDKGILESICDHKTQNILLFDPLTETVC